MIYRDCWWYHCYNDVWWPVLVSLLQWCIVTADDIIAAIRWWHIVYCTQTVHLRQSCFGWKTPCSDVTLHHRIAVIAATDCFVPGWLPRPLTCSNYLYLWYDKLQLSLNQRRLVWSLRDPRAASAATCWICEWRFEYARPTSSLPTHCFENDRFVYGRPTHCVYSEWCRKQHSALLL